MRFLTLLAGVAFMLAAFGGNLLAVQQAVAQQQGGVIEQIAVAGNERIEPSTITSYLAIGVGDPFDPALIDQSLKALFATGLFADVRFERQGNRLIIRIIENPIINRIAFEGNDRLDNDELLEEVRLRPRIVFTRAKVRADVQRILELYQRNGRFAAVIEPKVIQLPQNRVDLVFEISEGPKTKIGQINFIGNREFSDGDLRSEIATVESAWWKIFTSFDTYDPDRLAFDRDLLRQFYLTRGYADFRVVSAVAELTPERDEFLITFVIEEGEIYDFGKIELDSEIRDVPAQLFSGFLTMREGETYDAKQIEDSIENLTNAAGVLGYAFVDIRPEITRDRAERKINIKFRILEAPRVYVERIDIHGNVRTLDRVVRREFRLIEGDAFNLNRMERSKARVQRLGFFREVEIEQLPGSEPDRVILDVSVQEEATGELSLGAGFSSLESFLFEFSIRERNFLGKGQDLRLAFLISSLRNQIELGFTEPYFLGLPIAAGIDLFRRETDFFTEASFATTTTGAALRLGFPLGEFMGLRLRYTIRRDKVEAASFFSSPFIEASLGRRTTSSVGYSLIYDTLNNRLRPTRGMRGVLNQDVAGLGGNVRYLRSTVDYDYYKPLFFGFIGRIGLEGGNIFGIDQDVRINDRFFIGGPRIRGFDIAGIGPRDLEGGRRNALGGNTYYIGKAELFFPLGEAARELGVQASAFADVGSLFDLDLREFDSEGNPIDNSSILDDASPRIAVGVGVSWESPFGPFRIDFAKAIKKNEFDVTETLQFNVGTTF